MRIPRTKTEIVANAKRRGLLKNFRSKLTTLKSADLDDMDYRRGKPYFDLKYCTFLLMHTAVFMLKFLRNWQI